MITRRKTDQEGVNTIKVKESDLTELENTPSSRTEELDSLNDEISKAEQKLKDNEEKLTT
ncbi:hypothetical protein [Salinibacillus kushneri]|uniref:hypothetical protein n=1 Tax=Salinibacillus kushneri TaxID=237682 RepID=UPI000B8930D9|nr:hypothetical protein [Salinibacillus kushneri]